MPDPNYGRVVIGSDHLYLAAKLGVEIRAERRYLDIRPTLSEDGSDGCAITGAAGAAGAVGEPAEPRIA